MLYPFKFNKEFIEKSYGSDWLIADFLHGQPSQITIGEALLLGEYGDYQSRVGSGFLQSNTLSELLEVYMGEIVGDTVYNVFGEFFPIAVKMVDAHKQTPIYIHPTSEVAYQREGAFGKDLFVYVLEAEKGSKIYIGLKDRSFDGDFSQSDASDLLNAFGLTKADVFYIPAGVPYSIGAGAKVLEVHQNSNVDYILSGSDHVDEIDQYDYPEQYAIEAINRDLKEFRKLNESQREDVLFFNGLYRVLSKSLEKKSPYHLDLKDSFVALFAADGNFKIHCNGETYDLQRFELILVPSQISSVEIIGDGTILEISISEDLLKESEEE